MIRVLKASNQGERVRMDGSAYFIIEIKSNVIVCGIRAVKWFKVYYMMMA